MKNRKELEKEIFDLCAERKKLYEKQDELSQKIIELTNQYEKFLDKE